jgi:hypothetical protein
MSISTTEGATDAPAAKPDRLPLPEGFQIRATELETFYRHLPRLLQNGEQGKYVVVHGDQTFGVWDTFRDAVQFGHGKFDDGRFLAQKIDPRLGPALAPYFGTWPEGEPG